MMNEKITLKADFNVLANNKKYNVSNFNDEVKSTMRRLSLGNYCIGSDVDEFGDLYENFCVYDPTINDYIDITSVIYGKYNEDGEETAGLYGEIIINGKPNEVKQIKGLAEYFDDYDDGYNYDGRHYYEDNDYDYGYILLTDETSPDAIYKILAEIITIIINNEEEQAA